MAFTIFAPYLLLSFLHFATYLQGDDGRFCSSLNLSFERGSQWGQHGSPQNSRKLSDVRPKKIIYILTARLKKN